MAVNVIYARKSSESEDRQVLSVDAQVREMKSLAAHHGLEVAEIQTEMQSAKAPGRPVFGALMRRVYKGQIGTVLSWKMDRLSRNHLDSGNLMHALAEGLIQRIITIDGVKTPSGNDRLMGAMELAFSTKFIDDLRTNTKRGLEERLRQGWVTYVPPTGYLNDSVNHTVVADPERLPLVRKMFDLFLSGAMTPDKIRLEANQKWGFRTMQRRHSGGKSLARSSMYRILANPFYAGLIPSKGRLLPGKHPAIITWEEHQRALTMIRRDGRQRPKHHEFAFTGIFKCGSCGSAMTAEEHVKRSGRRYVYYRCSRTRATSQQCREPAVPESQVVEQLSRTLGQLAIPEPILAWLQRKVVAIQGADRERGEMVRKTLEESIRSTEREIANLLDLRLRSIVPDAVFTGKNQELEQRKASLGIRLETAAAAGEAIGRQISDLMDFASAVREKFLVGSPVRQRTILESVGSNYLVKGRKVSFHLETPLRLIAEAGSCSNWLRLVDDVRTHFLTTTEYFRIRKLDESISPVESVAA